MKRDYQKELENRVEFIKSVLAESGARGIVFGNSGGKDSALVGILCKKACENTLGVLLPCESKRNFTLDKTDAFLVANKFNIESEIVDITSVKKEFLNILPECTLSKDANMNINPRIRMSVLYAIAASKNYLVAGTGNRSETYMGYFTKWGDGACDFNPIKDLTVREIYEFLEFLDCPKEIITKAPSAALFEGQTDEEEMGVTYNAIDDFLLKGEVKKEDKEIIDRYHSRSHHKRRMPKVYKEV